MRKRGTWILALIVVALAVFYFSTRKPAEVADGTTPDGNEAGAVSTTTTTTGTSATSSDEHPYLEAEGDADCSVDCSGHEAGWKWAKEHDVTSEDECSGNSQSFIEGCQAYARREDSEEGEPATP